MGVERRKEEKTGRGWRTRRKVREGRRGGGRVGREGRGEERGGGPFPRCLGEWFIISFTSLYIVKVRSYYSLVNVLLNLTKFC